MNLTLSYIRTILSLARIQLKSLPWAIHKCQKTFYLDIPRSPSPIPHLRNGLSTHSGDQIHRILRALPPHYYLLVSFWIDVIYLPHFLEYRSTKSVSPGTLRTWFFVEAYSSRAVRSLITSSITCDSLDQLSLNAGQPTRSNPFRDESKWVEKRY